MKRTDASLHFISLRCSTSNLTTACASLDKHCEVFGCDHGTINAAPALTFSISAIESCSHKSCRSLRTRLYQKLESDADVTAEIVMPRRAVARWCRNEIDYKVETVDVGMQQCQAILSYGKRIGFGILLAARIGMIISTAYA
jgi:hypothetical protein